MDIRAVCGLYFTIIRVYVPPLTEVGSTLGVDAEGERVISASNIVSRRLVAQQLHEGSIAQANTTVVARGQAASDLAARWPLEEGVGGPKYDYDA